MSYSGIFGRREINHEKRSFTTYARRIGIGACHIMATLLTDAKAIGRRLVNPTQQKAIVERHFDLLVVAVFFAVLAFILRISGPR